MIVFTPHITPRVKYIFNFFATAMSVAEWRITSDAPTFINAQEAKINYSVENFNCPCLQVPPHGLLFETSIQLQRLHCTKEKGTKIFFQNASILGFDIFAASFYLLSRYEEYLPHTKDTYGRYAHENALAYTENFYGQPLINIWMEGLKVLLKEQFSNEMYTTKAFSFLPTYDIDMAWSYLHKGLVRNAANLLKDFFTINRTALVRRTKVLAGIEKDPYDTFEWMDALHKKHRLTPHYFFLVAGTTAAYDKNIRPGHPAMQRLIQDIAQHYPVGLHPSWQSGKKPALLMQEKKVLSNILGRPISSSRQHYLQLGLPHTYRQLIEAGITADFTMGYSGINGFRASVATPFVWYDLEKNTATALTVYPFCYMEATSMYYKKDTPAQALQELRLLHKEVKKVNGLFSIIWHNSSFSNIDAFTGWREMYEQFIQECCG